MRKNATLSPWSGSSGLASEIDRTPFELLTSGAAGAVLHGVDPLPQSGSTVSGADAWPARRPLGPVSYAWTVYVYDADGFGGVDSATHACAVSRGGAREGCGDEG